MSLNESFQKDIADITKIPIVSNLLDVVCETTGMGFAAIARVTEDKWIACSVRDDIGFGLKPGGELEIKTTICNEIRQDEKAVVIDHVSLDPKFKNHHTPAMYGFESYISVPILRKDGSFFGTLCAIDPKPHFLSSIQVTGMFYLFADLISLHLDAIDRLEKNNLMLEKERAFADDLELKIQERTRQLEENNEALEKMNKELQAFAYISSHDLQEPLRKIQTFASVIIQKEFDSLTENGRHYFKRMQSAAERMQILIDDLLAYSRTNNDDRKFESTDLNTILQDVMEDIGEELQLRQAEVEVSPLSQLQVIPFQFRQLLYNLFTNAMKFSSPERSPRIKISSTIAFGSYFDNDKLSKKTSYCHISFSDNGIGFEQKYGEKIFELFQRLHGKLQYVGTGIGLAIVRKIVENHGGIITAKGELGKGATFDIYIPETQR
jgi:signal transduction histidine kinase